MVFSRNLPFIKDDEGYLFIDRDGTHFQKILDYLEYGCEFF